MLRKKLKGILECHSHRKDSTKLWCCIISEIELSKYMKLRGMEELAIHRMKYIVLPHLNVEAQQSCGRC